MGCGASRPQVSHSSGETSVPPCVAAPPRGALAIGPPVCEHVVLVRRSPVHHVPELEPELEPEPEQRPFPPPQLAPEHRAFVIETICWQRYYLTDDPNERPRDATELYFCLMEPWQQGFAVMDKANNAKHRSEVPVANNAPAKRNAVSEWLASVSGLAHKAPQIEEQLYIRLWEHGLPLTFGRVPLDLEAICGERSLTYLHRLVSTFGASDVETWSRLADFSIEEAEIFSNELRRLGTKYVPADVTAIQPTKPARKKKKHKRGRGPEMKMLGEDPELRRRAAEKIQAAERGRWARRDARERRRGRGKGRKKTAAEKMREERIRHEELIRQHEAATKIQAAQRGKRERRRARSRKRAGARRRNERDKSTNASAATKIQAVHRGRRSRCQQRSALCRQKQERPTEEQSKSTVDVAAFKAALARYDREFEPQASLRERQRQAEEDNQKQEEAQRLLRAAQAVAARRERSRRLQVAAQRATMLASLYKPKPLNVAAFEERRARYTETLEATLKEITSLELPVGQSIRELSFEPVRIQQQQGKLLQQTQQSEYASTKQTHMSQRVRPQSAVADCVDEMIRVTEEQAEAGALDLELE